MNTKQIAALAGVNIVNIETFQGDWMKDLQDQLLVEKTVDVVLKQIYQVLNERWGGEWAEVHNPLMVYQIMDTICGSLDWRKYANN